MKIIDSGNYIPTTYRFHCTTCNCVYEVNEWELQQSSEDTFPRHSYTYCPICANKISTCYAEIVTNADTLTETITESETKSESTENCCENCAYLGTRNDDSHFCMIPGKTPATMTCDCYKSKETYKAERTERTKLREAIQFLQNYCTHNRSCKGCPFYRNENGRYECNLVQIPRYWGTDCLM